MVSSVFNGRIDALYVVRGTDVNTVNSVSKLVESGVIYSLNIRYEKIYGFKLHMERSTLLVRS